MKSLMLQYAVLSLLTASASALAEEPTAWMGVTDDASLDRASAQYRNADPGAGSWRSPCVPEALAIAESASPAQEAESGDALLTRIVAGYTRDVLDRGGWKNPYVPTDGYDSGSALLAVAVGDGVTTVVAQ